MPYSAGAYEMEYDYEGETDNMDLDNDDNMDLDCDDNMDLDNDDNMDLDNDDNMDLDNDDRIVEQHDVVVVDDGKTETKKYGYGIDTNSYYLARNGVKYSEYYDNLIDENGRARGNKNKGQHISTRMSIYIPDLGITPKYFKKNTREEINSYLLDYVNRVLCFGYYPIVKTVHKIHTKMKKRTDTISCRVYVEWYDNMKTQLLQKDIKNKKTNVSVRFEDGFEWKLRRNYKPVGEFNYEEKLRAKIKRLNWKLKRMLKKWNGVNK
jgi:hypothetical protein